MQTLDEIRAGMCSPEPRIQVKAVEDASSVARELSVAAVGALERGPNRFLVAERLHRFGSVAILPLRQILADITTNREARILAAVVLLQMREHDGEVVSVLFDAVESDPELAALCATHLTQRRIAGAERAIVRRMRLARLDEVDLIVALILALRMIGCELPPDLAEKFTEASVPWQIRRTVSG